MKHERLSIKDQGFCRATRAVELGLELATKCKHTGLLLPADLRYAACTRKDACLQHHAALFHKSSHTCGVSLFRLLPSQYLQMLALEFAAAQASMLLFAPPMLPSSLCNEARA